MYILGISSYYHDSAAALLKDGVILAAAQEERFSRKKHDSRFPIHAIEYCLKEAAIRLDEISEIVFYDKPIVKFWRLIATYLTYAPLGFRSFKMAMPVWVKEKMFLKQNMQEDLAELAGIEVEKVPKILFAEHHQSHAASAFYPSPFEEAAVMCLDGVGEWATTSVWKGKGKELKPVWEIHFPHSLGMLYSAFTYYVGFKVNSGEYKLMGLAPYGEPKYVDLILNELMDLKDDGTFRLNMKYFNFATGLTMTNKKFEKLFGAPRRKPESEITQKEMDIAASIQKVTEKIVMMLANTVRKELNTPNLCLAGGVALNCVANGILLREGPFENIWIQPSAGDAGGALGAALVGWHDYHGKDRSVDQDDSMNGSYLGPKFLNPDIEKELKKLGAKYEFVEDKNLYPKLAGILDNGDVIGWSAGRMEFGPRALGGRSIIGDPRNQKMQSVMNLKIKYRESFRPFAPVVLEEDVSKYFEMTGKSPYMLIVAPVKDSIRKSMTEDQEKLFGIEKLNIPRSEIPAVTHVDYSARIQTVGRKYNPRFRRLMEAFREKTGCSVLVNTSFNVRGEPIVCDVKDAFTCFMRTEMDWLVLENCVLSKKDQDPALLEKMKDSAWQKEFELD